jgi:hypothetical protein
VVNNFKGSSKHLSRGERPLDPVYVPYMKGVSKKFKHKEIDVTLRDLLN